MKTRALSRLLPLCVLLLAGAGCAVLTVDVDVYKGPLMNHERVQLEQMSAAAIAAKPLLVRLRNERESQVDPDFDPSQEDYSSYRFEDRIARELNDILGLYEDEARLVPANRPKLEGFLDEGERRYLAYQNARKAFKETGERLRDTYKGPGADEALLQLLGDKPGGANLRLLVLPHLRHLRSAEQANPWDALKAKYPADQTHPESIGKKIEALAQQAGDRKIPQTELFSLADSYVEARTQIEALFTLSIAFIRELNDYPSHSVLRQKAVEAHAELLKLGSIEKAQTEGNTETLLDGLKLPALPSAEALAPAWAAYRREARAAYVDWLLQKPAARIAKVETLHVASVKEGAKNPYKAYGLSLSSPDDSERLENLPKEFESIRTSILQTPLSGGRRAPGLNTLIKNYLAAADRSNSGDLTNTPEFSILRDSLAGFAEKLLTISTFGQLLESEGSAATGSNRGSRARSLPRVKTEVDIDQKTYALLLQAVGNTLISSADELTQRHEHQAKISAFPHTPQSSRATYADAFLREVKTANNSVKPAPLNDATIQTLDQWRAELAAPEALSAASAVRRELLQAAASLDDTGQRAAAIRLIASAPSHPELPKDNIRATIDRLAAMMEYELIDAHRRGDDTEIARIEAALEQAYSHRLGLIYLRPAASYLRASNPVTSAQSLGASRLENMLLDSTLRALPVDFHGDKKLDQVAAELDRKNWQNINRIRVAGAGNTNYVVAKDDIGNWYVKNYAADPEDIVKSAATLAKIGTGLGGVPANSAAPANPGAAPQTGTTAPTPSADTAAYLEQTQKDFRTATETTTKAAAAALSNLPAKIKAAWDQADSASPAAPAAAPAATPSSSETASTPATPAAPVAPPAPSSKSMRDPALDRAAADWLPVDESERLKLGVNGLLARADTLVARLDTEFKLLAPSATEAAPDAGLAALRQRATIVIDGVRAEIRRRREAELTAHISRLGTLNAITNPAQPSAPAAP